ncbi:MAG: carboxypeptidase regulatory-like domain-containing protein, partial [Bdellovibrionales bacterium]|nr:carboxypeptidase regulatory-like domain-containing protein [Bdellovibrionales bacterium]
AALKRMMMHKKFGAFVRWWIASPLVLLLMIVLLSDCSGGTRGSGGVTVTGKVVDRSGNAFSGSTVTILQSGDSTSVDDQGEFALANQPSGTLDVLVERDEFSATTNLGSIAPTTSTVRVLVVADEDTSSLEPVEVVEESDSDALEANENEGAQDSAVDDSSTSASSPSQGEGPTTEDTSDSSSSGGSGSVNGGGSSGDTTAASDDAVATSGSDTSGSSQADGSSDDGGDAVNDDGSSEGDQSSDDGSHDSDSGSHDSGDDSGESSGDTGSDDSGSAGSDSGDSEGSSDSGADDGSSEDGGSGDDGGDGQNCSEKEFVGTVQAISSSSITVKNTVFVIDSSTKFNKEDGPIEVGDRVHIHGKCKESVLVATEIELDN